MQERGRPADVTVITAACADPKSRFPARARRAVQQAAALLSWLCGVQGGGSVVAGRQGGAEVQTKSPLPSQTHAERT